MKQNKERQNPIKDALQMAHLLKSQSNLNFIRVNKTHDKEALANAAAMEVAKAIKKHGITSPLRVMKIRLENAKLKMEDLQYILKQARYYYEQAEA